MRRVPYERKIKQLPQVSADTPPDWVALLRGMTSKGYPKSQIAMRTQMTREKFYAILAGRATPSHYEGCLILKLHEITKEESCAT